MRSARFGLRIAAGLVIVGSAALIAIFLLLPHEVERYTAGTRPRQFTRDLDPSLLQSYPALIGIAHNAGDSVRATNRAVARGADVIEIDVVLVGGRLHAGHERPLPVVGKRVFRGPRLEVVWESAVHADAIELDLKQSSRAYLRHVISFLDSHREARVIVASPSIEVLTLIRERVPQAVRLLSIPNQKAFSNLRKASRDAISALDGVSIHHVALTETASAWLDRHDLRAFVWVINDLRRLNALMGRGIDGVTSDNLAMIELLAGVRSVGVTSEDEDDRTAAE